MRGGEDVPGRAGELAAGYGRRLWQASCNPRGVQAHATHDPCTFFLPDLGVRFAELDKERRHGIVVLHALNRLDIDGTLHAQNTWQGTDR